LRELAALKKQNPAMAKRLQEWMAGRAHARQ
jgi:hypothetical protein